VIVDILAGDTAQLPPHVNQKAFDRIEGAAKRNPSIDPQECAQLAKRLEYCDLRELQDIILSKASWPLFEPHFASASKEILMGKFAQLAELRNTIRHSRAVDEITRKEGEAAILWFSKILS
jgi:hypothetical protein